MSKATFPETAGNESQKPLMDGAVVSSDMRNALSALFQGDIAPLRTRAQSTPNMTVAVNPAVVQNFFKQVNRNKQPVSFAGGNSSSLTAPTSNPRIDILYLNNSGSLAWITGSEGASPSANWTNLPDDGIPICTVYCKVGMTAIVNFEDSTANPTQGYIYEDVRPIITMGAGSAKEIKDADGNTKIQVEESANEDKIRFDTAGVERLLVDSNGLTLESGQISHNPGTAADLLIENKGQDKNVILKINDGGVAREALKILGDTGIIEEARQAHVYVEGSNSTGLVYDTRVYGGAYQQAILDVHGQAAITNFSGSITSVVTNKCVDSAANFPAALNDGTYYIHRYDGSRSQARITARDSATQLSLDLHVFTATSQYYDVMRSRITIAKWGRYLIFLKAYLDETSSSGRSGYASVLKNNSVSVCGVYYVSSNIGSRRSEFSAVAVAELDPNDYLEPRATAGDNPASSIFRMSWGIVKIM